MSCIYVYVVHVYCNIIVCQYTRAMRSTASTLPSSSSVRNEGSDAGAKNSASLISNRSRKLADQKEEKDRRLLSQLMSNANARTGPEQSDCGDSVRVMYLNQ